MHRGFQFEDGHGTLIFLGGMERGECVIYLFISQRFQEIVYLLKVLKVKAESEG